MKHFVSNDRNIDAKITLPTLLVSILLSLLLGSSMNLLAKEIPSVKPEKVGLSSERLLRINQMIERHIDAGHITGAVTVVARRGRVAHFEAHGYMDVDAKTPMPKNAIFRMASSTKPIAGVAVLMLLEQGKLHLTDPVHKYIPEFKEMMVAVPKEEPGADADNPAYDLVPAVREITIRDLLTHTSGLLSGRISSSIARKKLERTAEDTLANSTPKLAGIPLEFQPGTTWRYSPGAGIDVLARIVEIVSGQSFDQFLRQHIFEPLDMLDTFFNLPEEQQSRLLPLYQRTEDGWQARESRWLTARPKYFSGSGGLKSTAHDYLMFEQMLVNGGQLHGNRLLSPRTVELMAANHVGDLFGGLYGGQKGMGFGLTVAVVLDAVSANSRRSNGAFGWGGAFGTISWTDPKEQLTAVLMLQQPNREVQRDFENAVMQAIVE